MSVSDTGNVGLHSGVYSCRQQRQTRDPGIPTATSERFGALLANLVPLDDILGHLNDYDRYFTSGLGNAPERGENENLHTPEEELRVVVRPSQGRANRKSLHLWSILAGYLGGPAESITWLIPVPEMPDIDVANFRQTGDELVQGMIRSRALEVFFEDGSHCLSSSSMDASKSKMDWSLSTPGPLSERSKTMLDMCSGRMRSMLAMQKVPTQTAGLRERLFSGLGLGVKEVKSAVETLAEWGNDNNEEDVVLEGDAEDCAGVAGGEAAKPVCSPEDERLLIIRQVQDTSETNNNNNKRLKGLVHASGLSSSSDICDQVSWEYVCSSIPMHWIYAIEQTIAACADQIDWNSVTSSVISTLSQLNFALVDEAAFRSFEEQLASLPDHVLPIVEECAAVCRQIIHHTLRQVPVLNHLFMLRPLLDATGAQSEDHLHPKFEAARKVILTHKVLSPGKPQLVLLSKKHWNSLHKVLKSSRVSILQLSLPQHLSLFVDSKPGSGSTSSEGILSDFDCFFLSTDEDTLRQAHNNSIFRFFRKITLLESDPTCVLRLEPSLRSVHTELGTSVCLLKVDMGLKSAFRLEVPEIIPHNQDSRYQYQKLQEFEALHGKEEHEMLQDPIGFGQENTRRRCSFSPQPSGNGGNSEPWRTEHLNQEVHEMHRFPDQHQNGSLGEASYARPNFPHDPVTGVANNLFSDREDSFQHDSFLDHHSVPRDHQEDSLFVQDARKSFYGPECAGSQLEFCPSPFLQPSRFSANQTGRQSTIWENQDQDSTRSLFHQENQLPLDLLMHEPGQIDGPGPRSPHAFNRYYSSTHPSSPNERTPFRQLYVSHGWSPRIETPTQIKHPPDQWPPQYGLSPYAVQGRSPDQIPTPPPRFWPQPMNTVASFNHVEKMYDEMRGGRPKRRPRGKGEKFRRFK